MCRTCGEPDLRGSAARRRGRRKRLLEGAGPGGVGNGTITVCFWCDVLLGDRRGYLAVTLPDGTHKRLPILRLEQDRLQAGGPYSLYNLVPACGPCNRARTYDRVEIPDGCEYGPVQPERKPA